MKFHLTFDNKIAVCGTVANRPDTFLYNEKGFNSHLAKEYQCKKCKAISETLTENFLRRIENTFTPEQ